MKKLVILFSAFAIVACGDGVKDKDTCTADCNGQVPGDALCVTYDSVQFKAGTVSCNMSSCSVDTVGCTENSGITKNEFETCTGSDCATGLTCREGVTTGVNVCLTGCDSEAATDPCGTNRACTAWSATTGDGICLMADAARDGACLDNYKLCAAGAGDCGTAGFDDDDENIFRCKIECDQTDIGSTGSCGSEMCLSSGIISAVDPEQTCTTPGEVGSCNEGSCFEGWTDGATRCANQIGFCGTEQPILGAFDSTSMQNYIDADNGCNQIDDHKMCAIIPDGNSTADDEAQAFCADVGAPNGDGVCVAICEQDTGGDLDCGGMASGLECLLPGAGEEFYYNIQVNGTARVECNNPGTADNCSTQDGYNCVGPFGGGVNYCAKPLKMCMAP